MQKPIFHDKSGHRWKIIKWVTGLGLIIFAALSFANPSLLASTPQVMKTYLKPYLFLVIAYGFIKIIIFMYLSYKHKQQYDLQFFPSIKTFQPTVSILIPVYNEEKVIIKTITAVLKSDYPLHEVLVIDDGSTDSTAQLARSTFNSEKRVHILTKENGGKASALNEGFRSASGDIVITIDADTVFMPNTVSHLVKHFSDPEVAGVSGNCKIGNIRNMLTTWQHIEYVTSNNLEKRAFAYLNCLLIVPGSNGAWRRSVVEKVDFYDEDTLAEDTDLTLKIIESEGKVIYDANAISYEECPETVTQFLKQRYRWSFGILQSIWKHKKSILLTKNVYLKLFVIPTLLISYFFLLTAPLIDLLFLVAILSGTTSIYFYVILFYMSDALASLFAFIMEKEKLSVLKNVFFQRFAYRYLISFVVWKSFLSALKGREVVWQQTERTGNNKMKS